MDKELDTWICKELNILYRPLGEKELEELCQTDYDTFGFTHEDIIKNHYLKVIRRILWTKNLTNGYGNSMEFHLTMPGL